ncbi:MAG: 2-oxoacid:acceptor oxidoreductase subunit alpha [marine benthic group bacterium]|jgi:2-oxoglutarate ferredoxin oxidoreductase subunit alpha|nr:2-oxoacid:acceptor oxidoreductase subunit alpha [Gemmatimonadota bacterium]MCL7963154.1 2-oxoacid:acceptor oxidoreductase subunit alpha [Candidatus Carthagonibacter metallireducens]MCL7958420.1 2-oxoacid:acceptor oxidoreductase subunit alpha [Gemmatimonadota bacterium]MCL7966428.1 2-oxoacid:acceptor oxidoreductase subunit alpha [Gemmatimonadota bacterium]MCL7969519.1 2-oxoacid:acceptor oxidoreductase subunit alpha [Gemmatimonadota bacterium]
MTTNSGATDTATDERRTDHEIEVIRDRMHTVEIVSDSGEGAQKCGQIFGAVSAKMGNGVWTVEIIPAEIQPPARSPAGASGNRIRIGTDEVTNWGDRTNVCVAFNEQVLVARHRLDAIDSGALLLVENMWKDHRDEDIRAEWTAAMDELQGHGYRIIEVPMEERCLTVVDDARKGKNMFALGMLAWIFDRDLDLTRDQIAHAFRKKSEEVYEKNVTLLELGYEWASENLDVRIDVPPGLEGEDMVVMNGNQAVAFGAVAAGMELAAMYPITPATSVSHQLGEIFHKFGGIVHQAEDEIAAAGVAIGASYSGKVAFTITSGPGLALKTEFLGLAIMSEIPLVVIDVQRGGPSTGLPTKVEQSDLLATMFGQPGDAPHVVMAAATIEECFHSMITARRIAETFRTVVIVLTDANLATGVQPFRRPMLDPVWMGSRPDMSPVPEGKPPYDWDEETGLSQRFIPGQPGGMHTLTGLAHDEKSRVAYASDINQKSSAMRSRKLAVLHSTLQPPKVNGADSGDLLVVGWGSTKGAIEEAVEAAREQGLSVSSLHLRFLSPLEPGLREIFQRFRKVMTVEINYSDEPNDPFITEENRRRGQLAWLLRANTLVDVDCWTRVLGEPLRPGVILDVIRSNLPKGGAA